MAPRRRAGTAGAPARGPRRAPAAAPAAALRLRPRLYRRDIIALGPGKVAVLRGLADSGSLRETARALDMSYTRAWALVQTMNTCFATPLVATTRGGAERGAARLTPRGRRVLALYEQLVAAATAAATPAARALQRQLRA